MLSHGLMSHSAVITGEIELGGLSNDRTCTRCGLRSSAFVALIVTAFLLHGNEREARAAGNHKRHAKYSGKKSLAKPNYVKSAFAGGTIARHTVTWDAKAVVVPEARVVSLVHKRAAHDVK
mmetsp:Transcript_15120/g.28771  ORF Transcript_15120/g.28771 Transcript_15120/m.28771 type:complete len:121 (+) Transcript_15120:92-454(+)